jgi:hypothetical protein
MRISSAGIVAINNTSPKTWYASAGVAQFGLAGALYGNTGVNQIKVLNNLYYDASGNSLYTNNGYSQDLTLDGSGNFIFYSSASGTAGGTVTELERVRITSAGNVGIGTASPAAYANQTSLTIIGTNYGRVDLGAGSTVYGYLYAGTGGINLETGGALPVAFATAGTERMRIASNGQIAIGATTNPWSTTYSRSIYIEAGSSSKSGSIGVATASWTSGRNVWITNNAYTASDGTFKYVSSGGNGVGILTVANDGLNLRGAASGTADTTITNTTIFDISRGNTFALENGNSVAGTGISFPATQSASSDANTLDDYEEGTWLPNVGGTATYSIQTGRYTKVGNVVTVMFDMNISSIGTGSTASIFGLPFTSLVTTSGTVAYYESLSRAYTYISCYANAGTAIVTPTGNNATASTSMAFNGNSSFQNSSRIIGSITYIAS